MSPKAPHRAASSPATVDELLAYARRLLAVSPAETSPREASTLLGHVLELSEAQLIARGERLVATADIQRFRHLVQRRMAGEPVAYLLGRREFYGRDFRVDERVLIPRPETEHLVEAALALDLPPAARLVDIGTGSGAIAVTLACERQSTHVVATDLSVSALPLARENARAHGVEDRVHVVRGDLAAALDLGRVDLLVSNPPYVAIGPESEISPEVLEFEPHRALFAPDRGRALIARLMAEAAALRRGVHLLLEIGYDQGEWIREQARQSEHLELRRLVRDYGGHERTAVLRRR